MKRFDTHVGSGNASLQQRPEIFEAVGMNASIDVLDGVIDNRMGVVSTESLIGHESVGVECRASFDVLLDLGLQMGFLPVWDDDRAYFAAALKDAHNRNFVLTASSGDAPLADAQVHVAGLTSDESLIRFHFAATAVAHLHHGAALHSQPDAVKHEPCGFLGHAKRPGKLARANAILSGGDNPNRWKPLFETKRGILKYGSDLSGELTLGVNTLALPFLLHLQERRIGTSAGRADNAVRPAMGNHVGDAVIGVCEVDDGFLKSARAAHELRIGLLS